MHRRGIVFIFILASVAAGCAGSANVKLATPVKPAPVVRDHRPPPPEPTPIAKPVPPPEPIAAIVVGAQLDVPGIIEFDRDAAAPRTKHRATQQTLDDVFDILSKHPSITKVRVEGHTDNDGGDALNQKLSEQRARAIVQWLVGKGIAEQRLVAVGCAAKDPLVPNTSEDNKQRNRRTEFDIEEIDGKQPTDYTAPCTPNPKRRPQ